MTHAVPTAQTVISYALSVGLGTLALRGAPRLIRYLAAIGWGLILWGFVVSLN